MPGVTDTEQEQTVDVAIIGAGIVGLTLALGLRHRGIKVKIYEQQILFHGFVGGIGFSPNAVRCLELLHPKLLEAQRKTATSSGDPKNPNDWMVYLDGYHNEGEAQKELYRVYTGRRGFEGCVRAHFRDELMNLVEPDMICFGKRLERMEDEGGSGSKVKLFFKDGTTAESDVVIGCDGINSKVRRLILGEDHPAINPSYSHVYALRGIVPMERAIQALGEYKARNRHIHLGQNGYVITIPVAQGAMLNVVAMVHDPAEWPRDTKMTLPASKTEAKRAYAAFHPTVRGIIDAIAEVGSDDVVDRWAIFDHAESRAPTYARGRVCIAGDAAHAMAPHHGAGAGCGIEDALCLAELLAKVCEVDGSHRRDAIKAALESYSRTRLERTQWMVESSRFLGDMQMWCRPETGSDPEKCLKEMYWRSHKIWDHDEKQMVQEAVDDYRRRLGGAGK